MVQGIVSQLQLLADTAGVMHNLGQVTGLPQMQTPPEPPSAVRQLYVQTVTQRRQQTMPPPHLDQGVAAMSPVPPVGQQRHGAGEHSPYQELSPETGRPESSHKQSFPASPQQGDPQFAMMQQMFANQNELVQQLMQQRSGSKHRSVHPPPDFQGDPSSYEMWRRDLKLWEMEYCDVPRSRLAPILARALKGGASSIVDDIDADALCTDEGYSRIKDILDTNFREDSTFRLFNKYTEADSFQRGSGDPLDQFLRDFDVKWNEVERLSGGFTLPSDLKSFMLISRANLTRTQKQVVLGQVKQLSASAQPGIHSFPPYHTVADLVRTVAQVEDLGRTRSTAPTLAAAPRGRGGGGGGRGGGRGGSRSSGSVTCAHCKKSGHTDADCWDLHPERTPEWFQRLRRNRSKQEPQDHWQGGASAAEN
eukprot:gene54925-20179_t